MTGLEDRTDYPEFELIVVDNDSSDGTCDFLVGLDCPFSIEAIANTEPASFSAANAQGVERARHDLILFLNNDIEPFEPGWLRELVAAHEREGVAAVGATLLRSRGRQRSRRPGPRGPAPLDQVSGWGRRHPRLQHRGRRPISSRPTSESRTARRR